MRARGRPADGVLNSEPSGASLQPSPAADPTAICRADIPLGRPMPLLAAPHTRNPSGARAKNLPRQLARPAAARARRLSRVPPRAGPAYHVRTPPPARKP